MDENRVIRRLLNYNIIFIPCRRKLTEE